MKLCVVDFTLSSKLLATRLPFKFGVQVLKTVPLAELEIEVELDDGARGIGRASDLLVPKWFRKNPDSTPEEDSAALAKSIETAASFAVMLGKSAGGHPIFDTWLIAYSDLVGRGLEASANVLVEGFGTAMLERAMIDAVCRAAGCSFHAALQEDLFGFRAERLLPETKGWTVEQLGSPQRRIALRHTVGMLDPLDAAELPDVERIHDGLPQALDEDIARYGLRWFKIKVCGDALKDAPRLKAISKIVMPAVGDGARFTLDGNEQCTDLDAFAGMLEELAGDPVAAPLIERLELIEQPLPRSRTLDADANRALPRLAAIAPVIIDEADASIDSFRRAADLGYSGVSIKACKGVFRALANRALIDVRPDAALFQSGEDLTNLASIPLQQDLALQATLGTRHVERNGHHYFRGLDHLPAEGVARLLENVPGLYENSGDVTTVAIRQGELDLGGVVDREGFGGVTASMVRE